MICNGAMLSERLSFVSRSYFWKPMMLSQSEIEGEHMVKPLKNDELHCFILYDFCRLEPLVTINQV